jgi:hypothetical protein
MYSFITYLLFKDIEIHLRQTDIPFKTIKYTYWKTFLQFTD